MHLWIHSFGLFVTFVVQNLRRDAVHFSLRLMLS
jgi:hypothetical protein